MTTPGPVPAGHHLGGASGPGSVSPRMDDEGNDRTAADATRAADDDDPRCGWPKKDGSPCRNRVPGAGKVCRVHQKAALLDRLLAGGGATEDPTEDPADGGSRPGTPGTS